MYNRSGKGIFHTRGSTNVNLCLEVVYLYIQCVVLLAGHVEMNCCETHWLTQLPTHHNKSSTSELLVTFIQLSTSPIPHPPLSVTQTNNPHWSIRPGTTTLSWGCRALTAGPYHYAERGAHSSDRCGVKVDWTGSWQESSPHQVNSQWRTIWTLGRGNQPNLSFPSLPDLTPTW